MKILMIGPFPPVVNGVTVCNDFLFTWLRSKGEKLSSINTDTGMIASKQGQRFSIRKIIYFLSVYLRLYRVLGKDVIYITSGQTFWGMAKYYPFMFICWIFRIPYIMHIHGGFLGESYLKLRPFKKRFMRHMVYNSSGVIALSKSLAASLEAVFPAARIYIVENFYSKKLIQPPIERQITAIPKLLFLSNLMLGKGILDLLNALVILQDKGIDFEIALAGSIEDGMENSIKEKLVLLHSKITYVGLADFTQKKKLLYASDIFILPTWYVMEGQPLSIIEAYVTGNVVISTDQGGIPDISDYPTCIKTEKRNPKQLAQTIENTIANLPQLRALLHATSEACQIRFSEDRFGNEIQQILKGKFTVAKPLFPVVRNSFKKMNV